MLRILLVFSAFSAIVFRLFFFLLFKLRPVERQIMSFLFPLLFLSACLAALKPATGYTRMPKSHWNSHADLLNGTELFLEQDLSSRTRKQ